MIIILDDHNFPKKKNPEYFLPQSPKKLYSTDNKKQTHMTPWEIGTFAISLIFLVWNLFLVTQLFIYYGIKWYPYIWNWLLFESVYLLHNVYIMRLYLIYSKIVLGFMPMVTVELSTFLFKAFPPVFITDAVYWLTWCVLIFFASRNVWRFYNKKWKS